MKKNNYMKIFTGKLYFPVLCISLLLITASAGIAKKKELPRKWGPFELGASYQNLKTDLTLFQCRAGTSSTRECILIGYPARDDFAILKFYREKLVSISEFRANVDWEKTFENTESLLGKPTLPAYKSKSAVALIWQDKYTHITLTHLIKAHYVIYEIRDRATEPLYRKSVASDK